jgi:hypothetical protein
MKFTELKYSSNRLARENQYDWLKDKYAWITDEITEEGSLLLEKKVKEYFPNCEVRTSIPIERDYGNYRTLQMCFAFITKKDFNAFNMANHLGVFDYDLLCSDF